MKFKKILTFLFVLSLSFLSVFSIYHKTEEHFNYNGKLRYICYNTDNDDAVLYSTDLFCFYRENQNYLERNWIKGSRCGLTYSNENLTANFDLDGFNGLIVKNLKELGRNDILNANLWMKVYLYYSLVDEDGAEIDVLKKEVKINDVGLTKKEILSKTAKENIINIANDGSYKIDDKKNYDLKIYYKIIDEKCPSDSNVGETHFLTIENFIKSKCEIKKDDTYEVGGNYKYNFEYEETKIDIGYRIGKGNEKEIKYKLGKGEVLDTALIMSLMPDDYFVKKRFSGNKNIEYSIKVNSNECKDTADDNFDYYFLDLNLDLPREIILNL